MGVLCALAAPGALAAGADEGAAAGALPAAAADDAPLFDFDIPAQPLGSALQRYGGIARQPALYRSEIVDGRMSAPLAGRYSAVEALRRLLAGTGLFAERFQFGRDRAFILKPSPSGDSSAAEPPARTLALGDLTGYPGLIQMRVWEALCADPATRPGEYRTLLRFRVDAAGVIQAPRLIGSSGNARRDAAVIDLLQGLRLDSAPPPELPQPVTLLLLPYADGFALRCPDADTAAPRGVARP